jgi:RNA polymerase sigma-70 factor, ECF subfamily
MHTHEKRYKEEPETTDHVLIQQALEGNQEAFEKLVNRYKRSIFELIYHYVGEYHETEDILQQVWLQLYLSLATIRPFVHLKPWLITVARNCSMDFLRRKHRLSECQLYFSELEARNEEAEAAFVDAFPDTSPTLEELAERHNLQRELQHAIRSLPRMYCPVVWLFYTGQLNYAEIGRILAMRSSTVKTRFNRAKPFLRAVFVET